MQLDIRQLFACFLFSLTVFTAACETADDNTVESIRSCVDSASRAAVASPAVGAQQAQICDAMATATSIQTKDMQEIRFGIILLIENKLTQIASMAQNLQQPTGALSSVVSIMVFNAGATAPPTPAATDITYANRILGYGNAVGGTAATLGNLISVSTNLASLATISNAAQALTALQGCAAGTTCTPAQQASMASSIYSTEQAACASPSDQASTSPSNMCFQMKTAIGTATPATPSQLLTNFSNYAASH